MEDFIEVGTVDNVGGTTKEFDGGLLAEGALGPQNGDALGDSSARQADADLAPDGGDMGGAFEGPGLAVWIFSMTCAARSGRKKGVPSRFLTSPTRSATRARWFSRVSSCWSMLSIWTRRLARSGERWGVFIEGCVGQACCRSNSRMWSTSACTPARAWRCRSGTHAAHGLNGP